jgi:hypothetical protein
MEVAIANCGGDRLSGVSPVARLHRVSHLIVYLIGKKGELDHHENGKQ